MKRLGIFLAIALIGGCAQGSGSPSPASASGPAPGCPVTLAEVRAAVPDAIEQDLGTGGPFKNVTQQCAFRLSGISFSGGPSLGILVLDIGTDGVAWADSRRTESPGAAAVADVGDGAWVDATPIATELFAARGHTGLHIIVSGHDGVPVERLAALARTAFARL